ncbi:MAG: murein biosynthesis integral membrane protein MurJ [Chloroflexi bacterium]|nr:murein biosynthesis integral membrane protein MurJ [Chloroflexota bacterium]
MTGSLGLARAGMIVSGAFLVARALGLVRVLVIVNTFRVGPELDEFFAAFRIPDLIFQLVAAGALSSALVPVVSGLIGRDEHERAWRVVSTVTNLLLIGLAVGALVAFVAAPLLVPAITPGFDQAGWARTADLTRIMLLSPIFLALGSVATSLLNARGRFAASAMAPIVYNLAIIGGALLLGPTFGVTGLAVSVAAGSLLHLLVQLPTVRRIGVRYWPRIDLKDASARTALALMGPRAIGLGASQITFLVTTSLATLQGSGSLTAYNTAFTLLQIPIGVIGVPLGIVVLPALARDAALGRLTEFAALVSRALRLLLFVMLPITGISVVLRHDIVELLFGYGRFDARAVDQTTATFLAFVGGLAAHSLIAVLARAFYARQDTRTPVLAAVLAVVVNTALAIVLVGPLGLPGLGLAIAVAAWLETAVLFALLKRRVPELALAPIASLAVRALLVAVVAAGAPALVMAGFEGVLGAEGSRLELLVRMIVATLTWAFAVGALAVLLRIDELGSIVGLMIDAFRRPRRS